MVSSSWLNKHRKSELIDLAADADLDLGSDPLNKNQIVAALEDHLHANAMQFRNEAVFRDFYLTTRRSPFKATRDTGTDGEVKGVVRERGRRLTKVKPEPEPEDSIDYDFDVDDAYPAPSPPPTRPGAMASSPSRPEPEPDRRTPTTTIIQQRRKSLPPSPVIVVDEVEHAAARFYAGLDDLYTLSGIPEAIDWARESCSSIVTVHLAFLLMEAWGLSNAVIPWTYLFDFPSIHIVGIPSFAVKIPDLFVMLSASFWFPVLLWSATSFFVPLLFAYFFNLTVHTVKRNNARVRVVRYNYDPFVFNVAKFLVVNAVYGADILQGYVSDHTVAVVQNSQANGIASMMLVATYVCGSSSLWQATQR